MSHDRMAFLYFLRPHFAVRVQGLTPNEADKYRHPLSIAIID